MPSTNSLVRDLYCPKCAARHDLQRIISLCTCGSPLLVDYDYERAAGLDLRDSFAQIRVAGMWKYAQLLPVIEWANVISLGEGNTPLQHSTAVGPDMGMSHLYFKDESGNPTGSFKARGLAVAVSRAKELGIKRVIIPTAGNAGSAVAAYAARAGLQCKVIMPKDVPAPFLVDTTYFGAEIELVDGTIKDCGARAAELARTEGWFSMATLKEPYRIEGKKTMGYELAEQFSYDLPDVIIYPTGGGTGLIGMWKAFDEMEKMGWTGRRRPRLVSVQAEGCAPIVRAFDSGKDHAEEVVNPATDAAGLRVPSAIGDFLMLRAIRETSGCAVAVSDAELMRDTKLLSSQEGIFSSPEGGASLAGLRRLLDRKLVQSDERVVVFITGSGYKYLDVLQKWS